MFKESIENSSFKGRVLENADLAPYVAFRIGGPADFLLFPSCAEDIKIALELCSQESVPLTILGSGSNVLVRDGGIRGAVLYLGSGLPGSAKILEQSDDDVLLSVPAHWTKARLLDYSLSQSYAGLEFSAGIPGTLGGAVFMNAGTKWGSYSDVLESVEFFKKGKGFYSRSLAEMGLSYRSHSNSDLKEGAIVVSVNLRLRKAENSKESRARVDEILGYRGSKQPLELPNCGSVFMNPENSEKGAGRLIEACNLKGVAIGGAMFSLKHANFILNTGKASSRDVEALVALAKTTVKKKFGVELNTEVIVLGENSLAGS